MSAEENNNNRRKAFSLIEVLVALFVIAILATLIVSVVGRVKAKAHDVTCVSNLRQIGLGIAAYTQEHSYRLPGPLLPTQGPRYNKVNGEDAAYLASYIAEYIGIPKAQSGPLPTLSEARIMAGLFSCPAFEEANTDNFPNTYFMRWKISELGTSKAPWGNYGTSTPRIPMNLLAISDVINPATTWAMCDLDQLCPDLPAESWVHRVPEQMVHGHSRNALYFDWHVGKISETGENL